MLKVCFRLPRAHQVEWKNLVIIESNRKRRKRKLFSALNQQDDDAGSIFHVCNVRCRQILLDKLEQLLSKAEEFTKVFKDFRLKISAEKIALY